MPQGPDGGVDIPGPNPGPQPPSAEMAMGGPDGLGGPGMLPGGGAGLGPSATGPLISGGSGGGSGAPAGTGPLIGGGGAGVAPPGSASLIAGSNPADLLP